MYIPEKVLNKIEKRHTDNDKIYVAEDMYNDIMSDTKETYKSYHMSVLANALELYYKGVLEESGLNIADSLMNESHDLYRLNSEISSRIQELDVCDTKSDERALRYFLRDLSALYIDSRYHFAQTSYEDFCKCRDYLKIQRDKCMSLLDPSRKWDKQKQIIEANNLSTKSYTPSEEAKNFIEEGEEFI